MDGNAEQQAICRRRLGDRRDILRASDALRQFFTGDGFSIRNFCDFFPYAVLKIGTCQTVRKAECFSVARKVFFQLQETQARIKIRFAALLGRFSLPEQPDGKNRVFVRLGLNNTERNS